MHVEADQKRDPRKQADMPRKDDDRPFLVQPSRHMVIFLLAERVAFNFSTPVNILSFNSRWIFADATT